MNEDAALQQLADILPPPAPGAVDWLLPMMAAAVVLIALIAAVWFMKRRRPRYGASAARAAQQRLAELRTAWQARTISDREAAYRLATLLRLGLALPQLAPQTRPAAVEDEALWHETLAQLNELRYRDQGSATLSPQCFERAEQWLAAAQGEAR